MAYLHGIYTSEVATSVVAPVNVDSAIPVFFVTAPVNLAKDPYAVTNEAKLCYTYKEAVENFGYNTKPEIWDNYTAVQAIYSQFVLYAVAPIVLINVLDPKKHIATGTKTVQLLEGGGILEVDGVLIDTVKIKKDSDKLIEGTDYDVAFNSEGFIVINIYNDIYLNALLTIDFTKLDPTLVDEYDIIGGYNAVTKKNEGIELIDEIYPKFRVVPGQIVAPIFSENETVASIMETKASVINGCFSAVALIDIPSSLEYTEVPAYKNNKNLVLPNQILCYPKVRNGEQIFSFSTQQASLTCKNDAKNEGVPFESPSNKNMKITGVCDNSGKEVVMQIQQANYLNSNGIVTALNFSNGFTSWGNRTAIYPSSTDVKDSFISIRRMFNWIGNTLILTHFSKIDSAMNNRNIETILNSANMWLNSLVSRGYLLGGKVEFLQSDNSIIDLLDGNARFRVTLTPPIPLKSMTFIKEFGVDALQNLFSA